MTLRTARSRTNRDAKRTAHAPCSLGGRRGARRSTWYANVSWRMAMMRRLLALGSGRCLALDVLQDGGDVIGHAALGVAGTNDPPRRAHLPLGFGTNRRFESGLGLETRIPLLVRRPAHRPPFATHGRQSMASSRTRGRSEWHVTLRRNAATVRRRSHRRTTRVTSRGPGGDGRSRHPRQIGRGAAQINLEGEGFLYLSGQAAPRPATMPRAQSTEGEDAASLPGRLGTAEPMARPSVVAS